VSLPGFQEVLNYPVGLSLAMKIDLHEKSILMLSFQRFQVHQFTTKDIFCILSDSLALYIANSTKERVLVWKKCGFQCMEPMMFRHPVSLVFNGREGSTLSPRTFAHGFLLQFSILPAELEIVQAKSGLFNCSHNYDAFRYHLDCNVKVECEGGEDETEACPYTSHLCPPEAAYAKVSCFSVQQYWQLIY
jgi:hypothetical protein